MQIKSISIPKSSRTYGLEEIKMSKLSNIVIIAGKNGSGKTRLFNIIQEYLEEMPLRMTESESKKYISELKIKIQKDDKKLEELKTTNSYYSPDHWEVKEVGLNENSRLLQDHLKKMEWQYIYTSKLSEKPKYVNFVPKDFMLIDSNELSKKELFTNAEKVKNIGILDLPKGAFAKIQYLQDQWFNVNHQNCKLNNEEIAVVNKEYARLKNYIKLFLDTELERDSYDGQAKIFGFDLGEANLSNGQKVLLQLCIALFSQNKKLEDVLLFLDEPENYLHPEALINVIVRLETILKEEGQLWIATHSVNLIAHYEAKNVWYIDNRKISYSGNLPEKILTGLLGDDDELEKLHNLIKMPSIMALNSFATESLLAPEALLTNSDDPQVNQIINVIDELLNENKKIKILDFGAGKGRLLSSIIEKSNPKDINLISSWLDYYAIDLDDKDSLICKDTISLVFNDVENRYFNNKKDLLTNNILNSFDLIIMCNVFHEIDPKYWISLLSNKHDIIQSLLKETGKLLIVEDQLIPQGEKAYNNGFLVLDTLQFKILFNIDNYRVKMKKDGRLKAHYFNKNVLLNINKDTRIKAIESIFEISKSEILIIRDNLATYKNGRLHAFWIHQLANSSLILEELK